MEPIKPDIMKLRWYYAIAFLIFWTVLFFAVIPPIYNHLPLGITVEAEGTHTNEFIADRAQNILLQYELIGRGKVVGSDDSEKITFQLLMSEIAKIERFRSEGLELEVSTQLATGTFTADRVVQHYAGIQNIIVKLSPANASANDPCLLINSHFDTTAGSPGAGDDGAMMVIMLEILRVLATSAQVLSFPIVFLFNGAGESAQLGAHGFITKHPWAPQCKAFINLDSIGSGNREMIFQTTLNHPWLLDIYQSHIENPVGTSVLEELSRFDWLPHHSAFRMFCEFGQIPGLDLFHYDNGYVYQTMYDKNHLIPRGTLQASGANILALVRALANSRELNNTADYVTNDQVIFYDVLRIFFLHYSTTKALLIHLSLAGSTLLIILLSLWRIAVTAYVSLWKVIRAFGMTFAIQIIGIVLAFSLPTMIVWIFHEADGNSMFWFTNQWLVLGLYICPALYGYVAPNLFYLYLTRNSKLLDSYRLQLILHSQAIILAILVVVLTCIGWHSAYVPMIALPFYIVSVFFNLITTLDKRAFAWTVFHGISQIVPFLYYSYLSYTILNLLIPIMGRSGVETSPDFCIAVVCSIGAILSVGFILPLLNVFRRSNFFLLIFLVITVVFGLITMTYLGFPYRAKNQVMRLDVGAVRRTIYDNNQTIVLNESGYYFAFHDRHAMSYLPAVKDAASDALNINVELQKIIEDCHQYLGCGLPTFNDDRSIAAQRWLPLENEAFILPESPILILLNKTTQTLTHTVRYEFEIQNGTSQISVLLRTIDNAASVIDWSFGKEILEQLPPYRVDLTYGLTDQPWQFYVDIDVLDISMNTPFLELAVTTRYLDSSIARSETTEKLVYQLPDFMYPQRVYSSYDKYVF